MEEQEQDQDQETLQVNAIKDLRTQIQMNSYGLPVGFYRVDMLPFHDYDPTPEPRHQHLQPQLETQAPQILEIVAPRDDTDTDPDSDIEPDTLTLEDGSDSQVKPEPKPRALFDPDTLEPLTYLDTSERVRNHPLIPTSPTTTTTESSDSTKPYRIAGFLADDLHVAFVALEYTEGFPTFENGDPFWNQLHFEPHNAHMIFRQYLQMSGTPKKTNQSIDIGTEVLQDTDEIPAATGVRSISDLSITLAGSIVTQQQIKRWAEIYYWDWRSRAYDIYRVVQHKQQQEIRAIETQDCHYIAGKRLQVKAMEFINSQDFQEMLTPKTALDALRLGTNLERIAAGLPLNGPAAEGSSTVVSAKATLQQVANGSMDIEEIDLGEGAALLLDQALTDPEQAKSLQSLILQVQVNT